MPIILVPLHFDRDPLSHQPSCQRSVVFRPFVTSDFMTGIAAIPGKHIAEEVRQILDPFNLGNLIKFFSGQVCIFMESYLTYGCDKKPQANEHCSYISLKRMVIESQTMMMMMILIVIFLFRSSARWFTKSKPACQESPGSCTT